MNGIDKILIFKYLLILILFNPVHPVRIISKNYVKILFSFGPS